MQLHVICFSIIIHNACLMFNRQLLFVNNAIVSAVSQ